MSTSDHKVNLPEEPVKWFRKNYGKDASLSWLLGNLLQSFMELHIEQGTAIDIMSREAAQRTQEIISEDR